MKLALLALAALAAGCASPQEPASFGGAFTEAATQAQVEAFGEAMRGFGRDVDVLVMESFPMQFSVRGLPADRCEAAREDAAARPYVASVGACR